MKIDKNTVHHVEHVGLYKGQKVYHVLYKGGFNEMRLETAPGNLEPMSQGSHRAIAKVMADQKYGGDITWDTDKLYKSEEVESTPEKHMTLANHHAKLANKYAHMGANPEAHASEVNAYYKSFVPEHKDMTDFQLKHDINMSHLSHKDVALKHYMMAGLDRNTAFSKLSQQVDHNMALTSKAPHSDSELHLAWNRKNKDKKAPSGLGYDFTN